MHTARSRRRALSLVLAAGALVSLSACGSDGVMTNGSTAATFGSHTVSTDAVQQAVTDINVADPQGTISGPQAALFLALEPRISKLASRYGATTTPSEVEQEFANRMPRGRTLSAAAIGVLRANTQATKLSRSQDPKAPAALQKLINSAEVKLNPRYGEFTTKDGLRAASANWIEPKSTAAQETPAQQ